MKDISIGDMVLTLSANTGDFSYAPVIALPHGKNEIVADFIHVTTELSDDLKLTPDHLILAGACSSPLGLMKASALTAGSCVATTRGRAVVRQVEVVQSAGVYTVVTTSDYLVVNNIVASPFAVSHTAANVYYTAYQAIYLAFPLVAIKMALVAVNRIFSSFVMELTA